MQRRRRGPIAQPLARLVVMVKEPRAGRVKTRLARETGSVVATSFYRHTAAAVIRRLAASARWETWLAVSPDEALVSQVWASYVPRHVPRHVPRRAQGRGDLGQRMQRIMQWPGAGPILIVGTDIPAITPANISAAFRILARGDAVLGPTPDGGFWLVGLNRARRMLRPFENVRWSSEHALADTARNLRHVRVGYAAVLADVDDEAAWRAMRQWAGRIVLPPSAAL